MTLRRAPTSRDVAEAAARQRRVVEEVLSRGVARYGCPCEWDRFVQWVGKEHPERSMDDWQNLLVRAAAGLPTFRIGPPARPEWWLQDEWLCVRCGARWKHYSEEWRMMAYRERLVREGRPAPAGRMEAPAVPGQALSPEAWAEFMLGEPSGT
ncbi:MAG: hypothetical protein GYA57_03020 [Myxococcales bacterium]|nr:hypothetical protein [Myxococcales bacterium]